MNAGLSPLQWLGVVLLAAGAALLARQLLKRAGQAGAAVRPATATMAASALLILLGLGGILAGSGLGSPGVTAVPGSGNGNGNGVREVDFGFVELDHGGRAVAVASYKHGGSMVLHVGEVLHYQAIGEPPLPPLELHLGSRIIDLPMASGQVTIDGAAGQPQPALMRAKGDRVSLPGGAPPRVSVKVQVTGPPRKR